MYKPKLLVYDNESCGINALQADLGYLITFGYIWLDDFLAGKKWKTISIGDFKRYKKDPHDDKELVKAALKILYEADGIIHHYGNRFDAPFIATRSLIHNLQPFPDVPMLDTCFLAYKKLKLSSNRLVNVGKVLNCKWQKLDKKDGWPKWWLAYSKGDLRYDKQMREYCGYDVMALAEIAERMRPYWPISFTNRLYPKARSRKMYCLKCGENDFLSQGRKIYRRKVHRRLQCVSCGFTGNYEKLEIE